MKRVYSIGLFFCILLSESKEAMCQHLVTYGGINAVLGTLKDNDFIEDGRPAVGIEAGVVYSQRYWSASIYSVKNSVILQNASYDLKVNNLFIRSAFTGAYDYKKIRFEAGPLLSVYLRGVAKISFVDPNLPDETSTYNSDGRNLFNYGLFSRISCQLSEKRSLFVSFQALGANWFNSENVAFDFREHMITTGFQYQLR